ncbi:hypothetical protein DPEC_G00066460 [Dallia pectoralis]|uniref:Uncharacterized protein n=1 Tax=Dallia pectoralis TaxID=75939 RepID=A0ACC2H875_DALPE|nr:hypothetical protein DPEC_G00066460 [Dallia pectoralis]
MQRQDSKSQIQRAEYLSLALMFGAFRQRRSGEPPLDRGPLPWLGHVLDFRRDTATFLEKMKRKHGDIFTVLLGGYYYTFVMDPLSFGTVMKEPRTKLDFNTFAGQLVKIVFGYQPMIKNQFSLENSNKHLMGDGLVVMTQAMMSNLQNLMLHSIGTRNNSQKIWKEDGLFNYSYNIVFRAGYLSLFGNETPTSTASLEKDREESQELFCEFRKYDQLFPKLVYRVLPPGEKIEAERLKRLFWNMLSVRKMRTKGNISSWVQVQQQERAEQDMEEFMQDRFMLLLLWASQSNTGPSSFWLLLYLMKHPDAMRAVRQEVEKVLKETGQEVKDGAPLVDLTRDMLLQTPILDSAVEETLRLTTAPILTRAVIKDMSLKMADGNEYCLREGDRLAMFPHTAVQKDPNIHPDPLSFKYDRFLTAEGDKKTEFYKDGKRLKYYNMPWGAGSTMCPGRFFATNELKQFVFLMLAYFDLELKNPDEKIPEIDVRRWGFGSMQPINDVQFRYRLKLNN